MSADTIASLKAEVSQHRRAAESYVTGAIYGRKVYACAKALAERLRELDPSHASLARWEVVKPFGDVPPAYTNAQQIELL